MIKEICRLFCIASASASSNDTIFKAFAWVPSGFLLPGQVLTHTSQPVQSRVEIWREYFNHSNPLLGTGFNVFVPSGAFAISSAVARNGRITAWGQAKEHWLHWIQFSGFHTGTKFAVPRFSYWAVPLGNVPSSWPTKAETGKSFPLTALIGQQYYEQTQGE